MPITELLERNAAKYPNDVVTFIEDEYKLHYLCYNDVKVSIYKDRGKWHLLRSRADYKDMQYDCDNKSRDFHRNRLEAINSGKFMQAA